MESTKETIYEDDRITIEVTKNTQELEASETNERKPVFRWILLGAIIAAVILYIFTLNGYEIIKHKDLASRKKNYLPLKINDEFFIEYGYPQKYSKIRVININSSGIYGNVIDPSWAKTDEPVFIKDPQLSDTYAFSGTYKPPIARQNTPSYDAFKSKKEKEVYGLVEGQIFYHNYAGQTRCKVIETNRDGVHFSLLEYPGLVSYDTYESIMADPSFRLAKKFR